MKMYSVEIHEQPYTYQKIKAKNKAEAELMAVNIHNGGNYESIYKTIIRLEKNEQS